MPSATRRVRLGTAVLLPALRHPLVLAHAVATVDRVSEGRLILGVGTAGDTPAIRKEFESAGVPFNPGQFVPLQLSVWDGTTRERGNRRGLTVWYHLYLVPEVVESPVGPMTRTALLVLAVELVAVFWVRRRFGAPKERTSSTRNLETSL